MFSVCKIRRIEDYYLFGREIRKNWQNEKEFIIISLQQVFYIQVVKMRDRYPNIGQKGGIHDWMDSATQSKGVESLYLTHGLHHFKGKKFPRLKRATINLLGIREDSRILDLIVDSGTILIGTALLGIESIEVEFNPMSYRFTKVKSEVIHLM